jgi:hypothetical protein
MNTNLEALLRSIRSIWPDSELQPLKFEEISAIQRAYPGVPAHYLAFLQQIGWGSLGPGDFMIYSGLVAARDVFSFVPELAGVWLIGDDYSGWCLGFDSNENWRMVSVDDTDRRPYPVECPDVAGFIAVRMASEPIE